MNNRFLFTGVFLLLITFNIDAQKLNIILGSGFFANDSIRIVVNSEIRINEIIYNSIPKSNAVLGYADQISLEDKGVVEVKLYTNDELYSIFLFNLKKWRRRSFIVIDQISMNSFIIKIKRKAPIFY